MARWIETLSEFEITIQHRPGRVHSNADDLSRQHSKQCWGKIRIEPFVDELQRDNECIEPLGMHALQLLPELSEDEISDLQQEDSIISLLKSWFDLEYEPSLNELRQLSPDGRKLWSLRSSLTVDNRILVRKTEENSQLIVPNALKRRLFDQAHVGPSSAYLGFGRTVAQLRDSYYWPGMSKDVQAWCNACDVCARSRSPPPRARARPAIRSLTPDAARTIVQAFIACRLDW